MATKEGWTGLTVGDIRAVIDGVPDDARVVPRLIGGDRLTVLYLPRIERGGDGTIRVHVEVDAMDDDGRA